ncbi:MAG: hypothetical protein V7739_15260 [Motiliproteus sp.]
MKRLLSIFSRPEMPVLLFGSGLLLFAWPHLSKSEPNSLEELYIFIFFCWSILIVGIALVSMAITQQDRQDQE